MDDVYYNDDLSDDEDIPNTQPLGQEEVLEDGQHIASRSVQEKSEMCNIVMEYFTNGIITNIVICGTCL